MNAVRLFAVAALAAALAAPVGAGGPAGHQGHAGHAGADPDPHAAHRAAVRAAEAAPPEAPADTSAPAVPDVVLVDQDGREVRFPDLVDGRVVAVNFVFTTCTTICPPMGATFGRLQRDLAEGLAERLGEEVHLVSVSVDPVVDTPARLAAWADRFGRRPGWTLLTGERSRVDRVLRALGAFTPEKEDHAPLVLVGDDRTGRWLRVYGLAGPDRVAAALERVTAEDGAAEPAGGAR